MKPGDVVKINGMPVTVEAVDGESVKIVWFEGSTCHRGSVSEAIAKAG